MKIDSDELVGDVFNLLIYLQTHAIKPWGKCFLPSATMHTLSSLMPSDTSQFVPGLQQDLAEKRVKFLLLLCYCAGLLSPISSPNGNLLKPTPAAARWLAMSMSQRAAVLAQALFADSSQSAMLWALLRLPGWRVVKAGLALARPFHFGDVRWALLEHESGRNPISRQIASVLPVPLRLNSDETDAKYETLLHAVLTALFWFGLITVSRRSTTVLRVNYRSMSLLQDNVLAIQAPCMMPAMAQHPLVLSVQAKRRGGVDKVCFVESKPAEWPMLFEMCRLATLISVQPRIFQLDHSQTLRAFDLGLTVQDAILLLERATGEALPHAVDLLLHRWWREHQQVQIHHVTLVKTESPELMDNLMRYKAIRRCLVRRLAPDVFEVREDRLATFLHQLRYRGIAPHVYFPSDLAAPKLDGFTADDWAHIYQALLIAHHLPEVVPLVWRAPDALVHSVAARLDPAQTDAIQAAVVSLVQSRETLGIMNRPNDEDDNQLPSLERVERAIQSRQWLRISYHTAGSNEVTPRDVFPIQIEWRGAVPYLIAFCNLRRDQRVFRLNRILSITDSLLRSPVDPAMPYPIRA